MTSWRAEIAALALFSALASGCALQDGTDPESLGQAEQGVGSGCVTIQRGALGNVEDAHIAFDPTDPSRASKNWGSSLGFSAGGVGAGLRQGLVRWDLSAVPSPANITSATATLDTLVGGGAPVDAHRVTAPWSEATVTYNSFGGAFDPTVEAAFPAAPVTSADLTGLVQDWMTGVSPNHGIFLQRGLSSFTTFASSEAPTVAQRPSLQVCYQCVAPVAFWRAENDMLDSAGTNHGVSGTQFGATPVGFGAGQVGSAFLLNGTSYVQAPHSASLDITGPITMEAWIKGSSFGGRVVDKITAGGENGYMLDTLFGRIRLIIGPINMFANTLLPTNTWIHIAGTWDGTTGRMYLNGVLDGTGTATTLPSNGLAVRIGADSNGQNRFNGLIDEVSIYNVALSAQEIAAIAQNGPSARCFP